MAISSLNTRVTILHYTSTQDGTTGKEVTTLTSSWEKWAEVKQNNGNRVLENAGIAFKESYTIKVKYEASRPTLSKYKIQYGSKVMAIHSVIKEQEGKAWFEIINAFTTQ